MARDNIVCDRPNWLSNSLYVLCNVEDNYITSFRKIVNCCTHSLSLGSVACNNMQCTQIQTDAGMDKSAFIKTRCSPWGSKSASKCQRRKTRKYWDIDNSVDMKCIQKSWCRQKAKVFRILRSDISVCRCQVRCQAYFQKGFPLDPMTRCLQYIPRPTKDASHKGHGIGGYLPIGKTAIASQYSAFKLDHWTFLTSWDGWADIL